jgi:hypothetical protein
MKYAFYIKFIDGYKIKIKGTSNVTKLKDTTALDLNLSKVLHLIVHKKNGG